MPPRCATALAATGGPWPVAVRGAPRAAPPLLRCQRFDGAFRLDASALAEAKVEQRQLELFRSYVASEERRKQCERVRWMYASWWHINFSNEN